VKPEQRKQAFALSRLAVNLGMSVGPAIGGFLALYSFRFLFFADGVTSILAGLVLMFAWPGTRRTKASELEWDDPEDLDAKSRRKDLRCWPRRTLLRTCALSEAAECFIFSQR